MRFLSDFYFAQAGFAQLVDAKPLSTSYQLKKSYQYKLNILKWSKEK